MSNIHDLAVKVDHIGSTAIKGILSKPIIDIQIQCDDPTSLLKIFQSDDYILMGEYETPGRQFIINGTMDKRLSHIHVYKLYNDDAIWNIWFVNFMNCHKDYAEKYSYVKQQALKSSHNDINIYMMYKAQFIMKIKSIYKLAQQGDSPEPAST